MPLSSFHPIIAEWFSRQLGTPTDVQAQSWPAIRSGSDVLISAPTGSGKTLAAFLSCIDALFKQALAREVRLCNLDNLFGGFDDAGPREVLVAESCSPQERVSFYPVP